jgi:exonuclease SbcC
MILDRLELTNFKRFRHAQIDFKDGITGILGNNGTGKSSLVQAIFFALYGVRATGISSDYIVSGFASPKEKCTVVLDFRIGGDEYKVIRTFRKGKTVTHDAEFYKNRKLEAKEVSPVEEAITRTLGMGPVDFKNTIYAGQKDLLTLLDNTPAKRKEWFQKALGIDYLRNGSDTVLREQIDAALAGLQKMQGTLEALTGRQAGVDPAALQAVLIASHAAIAEHGQARDRHAKQRAELDARQKALAEKKSAYDRLLQQQQILTQERDADIRQAQNLEASLAGLAEEDAEYHRIEKTAGSYEEIKQRLDALREKKSEHLRLSAELAFAAKEIAGLAVRAGQQEARLKELDSDLQKKSDLLHKIRAGLGAGEIAEERLEGAVSFRLAEINKQSGTLDTRLALCQEEHEKIAADRETIHNAGADGVCPLCRQRLGEHLGSLDAEFSARLQDLAGRAAADRGRQEKLRKEKAAVEAVKPLLDAVRSLDAKLRQRPVHEQELAALTAQRKQKEEEEHRIQNLLAGLAFSEETFLACELESARVQKVQLRYIELGKKIGQALMAKQHLLEITAKIAGRTAGLAETGAAIRAAAFDPAEAARLGNAIADTDTALRNEEVAIANADRDRKAAEEKIAEHKNAVAQIAEFQKRAAALEDEIANLKLTRSLIAGYVVYLMQVVRSRLEGEVSRIISEITGGRYEQVLLDGDFNLLVRDVDNDYPIDRFSGGEQDDIAVALRIALSRYLAELHQVHESTFLIFDEIFGSQDEERRSNLLTALRTQESRFPQILLISHIAEMQGEFANTLVIETGAGEGSRVRDVE